MMNPSRPSEVSTVANEATDRPVVVVMEDERDLADLYEVWLADTYDVRVAYQGEQGLEAVDESVSVVLLDRRMPGLSGEEILDQIRTADFDCRVAMVTAVEPDIDLLQMGFDDYITKPVSREDLRETVDRMVRLDDFDQELLEYYRLISKRSALEMDLNGSGLESSERYTELRESIVSLRERLDPDDVERIEDDVRTIYRGTGP